MQTSVVLCLALVAAFVWQGSATFNPCRTGYELNKSIYKCISKELMCKTGYTRFANDPTGSCYKVFTDSKTYQEASDACNADQSGWLPQVHDAKTDANFGNEAVNAGTDMWIGLTDKKTEGTFFYSDGTEPTGYPWLYGEPDNDCPDCATNGRDADCVHYCVHNPNIPYGWNDEDCETKNGFICESEPHYDMHTPLPAPEPTVSP